MDNVGRSIDLRKLRELGLSAKGEPLLNKDFCRIVEIAKKELGISYVYISTNGALLNEAMVLKVLSSGLDSIKFSINAITRESYHGVHGKDEFDKVLTNLRFLLAQKEKSYPKLKLFISSITPTKTDKVFSFFREALGKYYPLMDGITVKPILFSPARYVSQDLKMEITQSCPKPFNEVWINPNGDLALCCVDYFGEVKLGNLLKSDFLSVWNGPIMQDIRRMHNERKFPDGHICLNCLSFDVKTNHRPLQRLVHPKV